MRENKKDSKKEKEQIVDKIKKYWKVLLGTELVFLAIMMSVSGLIYKLYWDKVYSDSTSYMRNIRDLFWSRDIEHGTDDLMEEIFEKLPGTMGRDEYTDNFAIELSFYDEKAEICETISGKLAAISFEIYDEVNDEISYMWYDLTDYFEEEQIAEFRDFYYETTKKHGSATIGVQYVNGFYDTNGELVPTEIFFFDLNSDATVILDNSQKYEQNYQRKIIKWYSVDSDAIVDGMVYIWMNNTSEKCMKKLEEIKQGKERDTRTYRDFGVGEAEEDGTPELRMYADVPAIIIESDGFFAYIITSVILLQLCATFIMWGYVYFQEKQRELSESRDLFINAMAHELKTPAAVVQNTVEYLQTGKRPEKQEHYLDLLQNESVHMNRLLNDMLTYTRVSQTTHHLKLEKTNLKELVLEVMESYQETLQDKHRLVEWDEEAEGIIRCDRGLMRMVVDNLLSNAIKYGEEEGTIRITIRKKELAIFNSGPQLSEEALTQVWNPMYRVDKARTADGSSGMGLAISAGILKQHGATFGANNLEDGVEFYFSFEKIVVDKQKYSKKKLIAMACIYYFCTILALWTTVMYLMNSVSRLPMILESIAVLMWFGLGTFCLMQSRKMK